MSHTPTSQVKVSNKGRVVEYRWKRRRWQLDIRWGYLLLALANLAILGSAAFIVINFAVTGKLQLNGTHFLMLPFALFSPVWLKDYVQKFIEYSFESNSLQISGKNVQVTSWPFTKIVKLDADEWTQLYVSPTEELRSVNREGQHQVVAQGSIPDLHFIESELERRLKIENLRIEGEAWDLSCAPTLLPLHPTIQRQESDGRLKLTVPQKKVFNTCWQVVAICLGFHYIAVPLFCISFTIKGLFLFSLLSPLAWPGFIALYFCVGHAVNKLEFFADSKNLQVKLGPIPVGGNLMIPLDHIREVRFVSYSGINKKNNQPWVANQLEAVYGKQTAEVKVLANNNDDPEILRSLQSELNGFVQFLKAKGTTSDLNPQGSP